MAERSVYPGMVNQAEGFILDGLFNPFMLGSGVSIVLARASRQSIEVDVYFRDATYADDIIDLIDTGLFEASTGPGQASVRGFPDSALPFFSLEQILDSGAFPLFIAAGAVDVEEDTIRRRLPWMHRSHAQSPSRLMTEDTIANANIAELVAHAVMIGLDFESLDSVWLRVSAEKREVELILCPSAASRQSAIELSSTLESRLRGRPEVVDPWRWRVGVGELDSLQSAPRPSNQRLLLSRYTALEDLS